MRPEENRWQQENQWPRKKIEQMVRNNYQLKMMLMNLAQQPREPLTQQISQLNRVAPIVPNQPLSPLPQQQQQPKMASNQEIVPNYLHELKNNENNLQYKIVNLKLRVEPQNGSKQFFAQI